MKRSIAVVFALGACGHCFAGACCFDGDQCDELTEFQCVEQGGAFQGKESRCDDYDDDGIAEECDPPPAVKWDTLYYTNGNLIQRSDFENRLVDNIAIASGTPRWLTVSELLGKMYWIDDDGVFRSNLDGTSIEHLTFSTAFSRFHLDEHGEQIYGYQSNSTIRRCNLDLTDCETLFSNPPSWLWVARDPASQLTDYDGDADTDLEDFAEFQNQMTGPKSD